MIDRKAPKFGLHESLIIPIGAKSTNSIEKFVGSIKRVFGNDQAFLVSYKPNGEPNDLAVWKHQRSYLLNYTEQLWVNVNYNNYRKIYLDIFGNTVTGNDQVVDHIMNRKLARQLNYKFVRLLHISRKANSSSGRGGETIAQQSLPTSISVNPEINASEVIYADPMDLVKMLDIKVGGWGLENVAENHHLFYP